MYLRGQGVLTPCPLKRQIWSLLSEVLFERLSILRSTAIIASFFHGYS